MCSCRLSEFIREKDGVKKVLKKGGFHGALINEDVAFLHQQFS